MHPVFITYFSVKSLPLTWVVVNTCFFRSMSTNTPAICSVKDITKYGKADKKPAAWISKLRVSKEKKMNN